MECQNKNRRKSLRLKSFNYSNAGAYFVTICSQDMRCLMGEIVDGEMELNLAGEMVIEVWSEIQSYFPGFQLDEYILMPNHFHGVIWKTKSDVGVGLRGISCSYNSYALLSFMKVAYPSEALAQTGQPRGVATKPTTFSHV